jgi:hypothetical protein
VVILMLQANFQHGCFRSCQIRRRSYNPPLPTHPLRPQTLFKSSVNLSVDCAVALVVTQIKQNTNYKKSQREEIQISGTFSQEMN